MMWLGIIVAVIATGVAATMTVMEQPHREVTFTQQMEALGHAVTTAHQWRNT